MSMKNKSYLLIAFSKEYWCMLNYETLEIEASEKICELVRNSSVTGKGLVTTGENRCGIDNFAIHDVKLSCGKSLLHFLTDGRKNRKNVQDIICKKFGVSKEDVEITMCKTNDRTINYFDFKIIPITKNVKML